MYNYFLGKYIFIIYVVFFGILVVYWIFDYFNIFLNIYKLYLKKYRSFIFKGNF